MRLYLQRKRGWFNDQFLCVADENREMLYDLKYTVTLVKTIQILDSDKHEVAVAKQELKSLLPKYAVYVNEEKRVTIKKLFNPVIPKYELEGEGWEMRQDLMRNRYDLCRNGRLVASVTQERYHGKPSRVIDMADDAGSDRITALAMVVAIEYGIRFQALQTPEERSK